MFFLIVIGLFLILVMFLNMMSSCSVLAQAILSGGTGGTFPCEDADMFADVVVVRHIAVIRFVIPHLHIHRLGEGVLPVKEHLQCSL